MPNNRLAGEKSPYLLQHAHNPVDWYPWGEEAFSKARAEDKPIFLSVGYSTCHWCHVMERESFENEHIAGLLNRWFVPVKVDREERPDIDRIYMTFVQATTGGGGWPMSVWLTPELEPFFGGTYFPPDNRYGRAGFPSVLEQLAAAWQSQRAEITESARQVKGGLEQAVQVTAPRTDGFVPDRTTADSAWYAFRRAFDPRYGGFGDAPKFPRPVVHNFLLRYGNDEARRMVVETLRAMARGGIDDQLGGGFHRYSVDERWFVPHFEKMLYDQAQLAISYLEALQISGDPELAHTARSIFDYLLRDMASPEGAFYSAEDADSAIDAARPQEKGEGAFYIWRRDEIEGPAAEWYCYRYGVEAGGNVQSDPHSEFTGRNILYQAHSLEETAMHFGRPVEEVRTGVAQLEETLLAAREKRPRPQRDDKILTAWNGLAISAFALAGAVLGEPRYAEAARRAADFLKRGLYRAETGILLRRYRDGEAAIRGFLDDYAFFVQALLDLYEAQFAFEDLELALRLTEKQRELFEDPAGGGFFSTESGDPHLVLRVKEDYDGAEPSGHSVAVLNLLRLAQFTGRADLRRSADRALAASAARLRAAPSAAPQMLVAWGFAAATPHQIVVAGEKGSSATQALLRTVHSHFIPHRVVLLVDSASRSRFSEWLPGVAAMALPSEPAAYVCEDYTCNLPVTRPEKLEELLQ